MNGDRVLYLDSSAIVKLVVGEPETVALKDCLAGAATLVSSALARTEVLRAVLAGGTKTQRVAELTLARLELLRIDDRILQIAGELLPTGLRSLDAIHLASALAFGESLAEVVCYDLRLSEAAKAAGLSTIAPR
ncbi:MAG: type II toxin-antitoxin system VapC family toxin [Acidimicrobiales bacterium]